MNGNDFLDSEQSMVVREGPTTEITKVLTEGDPDRMINLLEKRAKLAPKFKECTETILVSQTYPADWQEFDGIMCLGSAGTERVARIFNIKTLDVKSRKELFEDEYGKGYRYVFEGMMSMDDRNIYAQGCYSTREALLGKANKTWKDVKDINENHIRNAAFHIFQSNGIKVLLGLRGIPKAEWEKLFHRTGNAAPAPGANVTHTQGVQGGTSDEDTKHQQELYAICQEAAQGNMVITHNRDTGQYEVDEAGDALEENTMIENSISALAEFFSKKDNKWVECRDIKKLKGKWLNAVLARAREVKERSDREP